MKKYLSLYFSFVRTGFIADLEYRANFLFRVLTDVIWYATQILAFEVLYDHTKQIGGWTLPQIRVFLGLLFVTDAFYMIMLNENLDQMTEKIRKGDLDLLLTKPINSQFMVSLQKVSASLFTNLVIGLSFLTWAIAAYPMAISAWRYASLVILIPAGLISLYAMRFFIATLALIFARTDNLQFAWYQIYRLGMRPDGIYPNWLKLILRTLLPMALIAALPADLILVDFDWRWLAWATIWSAVLLYGTHRFWKFGLSKYTSASS